MTAHNKLKMAILAVLASQHLQAITVEPIQIQSAPGELLYAEMNFHHAAEGAPVQAGLATPEELLSMGITHQPPGHLNFFTRRNGAGEGVITITSSRPMTESELNIVVRVKEGNAVHLQHIRQPVKRSAAPVQAQISSNEKPLMPVIIASEKDIPLTLPVSTAYRQPAMQAQVAPPTIQEKNLSLAQSTPPAMAAVSSTPSASVEAEPEAAIKPVPQTTAAAPQSAVSADPLVKKYAESLKAGAAEAASQTPAGRPSGQNQAAAQPDVKKPAETSHMVRNNESLWQIASRIAASQNRPVQDVMKQIKSSNEHAFIQGDANRLRRGVVLNLQAATSASTQKTPVSVQPAVSAKQSGKAKYRLNQAEMSLVAEKDHNSAHGSAKKDTQSNQTSDELSLKVKTAREKTVKLQRNVTQLDSALRQKDHRIQLLNARLAQLQQQLKNQQPDNKAKHQSATN